MGNLCCHGKQTTGTIEITRNVSIMHRYSYQGAILTQKQAFNKWRILAYCPFDITWKDVFCLAFYIFFWLTIYLIRNHLPFLFLCFVLKYLLKIKFTAKNWSDLCHFYSKVIFWIFCLRKYSLLFFVEFELLMFQNNIVEISEKLNKQNLLKICLQVTYPTDFCIICIHFYYWKKWKYLDF